jgi:hypothetical protein
MGALLQLPVFPGTYTGRIEPAFRPECHDPSCGACESCAKRAPLARQIFRVVRDAGRIDPRVDGGRGRRAWFSELGEYRQRELARRSVEQVEALAAAFPGGDS